MKAIIVGIALTLSTGIAIAQQSSRDKYVESFAEYSGSALGPRLMTALQQKGLTEQEARAKVDRFLAASVECHMLAMDMHAPEISAAAYDAVSAGGSYPDAKMAFELALGEAIQSGNTESIEKFKRATESAQACIQEAQAALAT